MTILRSPSSYVVVDSTAFAKWVSRYGTPDGVETADQDDLHGGYAAPVPFEPSEAR